MKTISELCRQTKAARWHPAPSLRTSWFRPRGDGDHAHLAPVDFCAFEAGAGAVLGRDPLKTPKDRLQAQMVQALWDRYLRFLPTMHTEN